MHALVIYESMFGNTQAVAEQIGAGIADLAEVEVLEVGDAPSQPPSDVTLLVVGGPTHAFGMSRAATRREAAKLASVPLVSRGIGIREWLDSLEHAAALVVAASFDTHVDAPRLLRNAGSAAGPIRRRLIRRGYECVPETEHFWVADSLGPLRDGELERARAWGRELSRIAAESRAGSAVP